MPRLGPLRTSSDPAVVGSLPNIWHRLAAFFPSWPMEYFSRVLSLIRHTMSRLFRFNSKPQPNPEKPTGRPPALNVSIPSSPALGPPSVLGKKKALLIGINYESEENGPPTTSQLCGPHHDVQELQGLLLDPSMYGYSQEDVVTMMDDRSSRGGPLEPTRENILTQIKTFVHGAKPGDHFFFHYSGHSAQIINEDNTEEDGMDEVIITCDCSPDDLDKYIKDDDLRKLLVDALPVGSSLVALFDTCHSASLLDLPHSRCNRIYVPWKSKGQRRTDTIRRGIVRQHAIPQKSDSSRSLQIYQSVRVGSASVVSRRSSVDVQPGSRRISLSTSLLTPADAARRGGVDAETLGSPIVRCSSPDAMYPCTGDCQSSPTDMPYVISLSASKDYQMSWEDNEGTSMTKIVIDILRTNPHPTLKNLMELVSHNIYKLSVRLHENHRRLKKLNRRAGAGRATDCMVYETENFQDPQISSHKPLDMNAEFTL